MKCSLFENFNSPRICFTGRHVSGLSRDLETLGAATGKIATGHHRFVRFVCRRGRWYATVGHSDRLVQLGSAVLCIR